MIQIDSLDKAIYLDGSATTPPRVEVINRIKDVDSNYWANPSSIHSLGIKAAEVVERSRKSISLALGASPNELIFTSGSTESIHLALLGSVRKQSPGRIVISNVEHPSVISAAEELVYKGWELAYWPVDKYGQVDLSKSEQLLSYPTKLVSIIWGQSEVGTIQPIKYIGEICKSRGIIFHTDATQILSQAFFNWSSLPVDLLSASAHKFQGPKGVGFLLCDKNIKDSFSALSGGGGQEGSLRSGTEPVSLIAGMALAIELLNSTIYSNNQALTEYQKVSTLTSELRGRLGCIKSVKFTGHPTKRLSNHISMLIGNHFGDPLPGRAIVRELSKRGIYASSGTACRAGRKTDSAILGAMNIPLQWRQSGLRFTLGSWINQEDIANITYNLHLCIESLSSG